MLRNLTLRFSVIREGDAVSASDKELWEYFAALYKNSNKGIKGRGKDRRIFANPWNYGIKEEPRSRSPSRSTSGQDEVANFHEQVEASTSNVSIEEVDSNFDFTELRMDL